MTCITTKTIERFYRDSSEGVDIQQGQGDWSIYKYEKCNPIEEVEYENRCSGECIFCLKTTIVISNKTFKFPISECRSLDHEIAKLLNIREKGCKTVQNSTHKQKLEDIISKRFDKD